MSFIYTTLAADTFHRANENPLANPPWAPDPGPPANNPCQIVSDECVGTIFNGSDDNEAKYIGISWPVNQWAQMQVDALATGACSALIILRRQDFANGYVLEIDGPPGADAANIEMYALVGGVVTNTIFTLPITFVPGAVMRMEVFGNQLFGYYNGVLIGQGTDSSFSTAGTAAIDLFTDGIANVKVSNFSGGLITESAPSGNPTQAPNIFGTEEYGPDIKSNKTSIMGTNGRTRMVG